MKLMKSLKAHRYAGKALERGDVFRARGLGDERLLIALGRAVEHITPAPVEWAVISPAVKVQAGPLAADETPAVEISERTGKPKRQYTRRNQRRKTKP